MSGRTLRPVDGRKPANVEEVTVSPIVGSENRVRINHSTKGLPFDLPLFVECERIIEGGALAGWNLTLHVLHRGRVDLNIGRPDTMAVLVDGVEVWVKDGPMKVAFLDEEELTEEDEEPWDRSPKMQTNGAAAKRMAEVEKRERREQLKGAKRTIKAVAKRPAKKLKKAPNMDTILDEGPLVIVDDDELELED